jgi:hypothetical protein
MTRPFPPAEIVADMMPRFEPAPELEHWARVNFISEFSPINNPDHEHLQQASLGFLWTNVENNRQMRQVLGQCELMPPQAMGKWQRARAKLQIEQWFGRELDFLITISTTAGMLRDDVSFMALVEHELYHAGQDRDAYGQPKFSRETGAPVFAIRGHDVEEFVGVVRRYGAQAAGVEELVRAANKGATVAEGNIARACGTCLRLVKG